uniref:HDC02565 n=1 Tax=Drosophila melanogaster TaxID=7227 RepID=Q6IHH6_DROME|nr:TPA_inf: HDC02565 [Drosophila melanogaster]
MGSAEKKNDDGTRYLWFCHSCRVNGCDALRCCRQSSCPILRHPYPWSNILQVLESFVCPLNDIAPGLFEA